MCTFEDERSVVVCDVAITRVRHDAGATFGPHVTYDAVEGQGTRVQADDAIDAQAFATVVRAAIAHAQGSTEADRPGADAAQREEGPSVSAPERGAGHA